MCVTGSGWAVKLELNLCVYRNGPIVKLLYFLTSAFVKQSLNTEGGSELSSWVGSLLWASETTSWSHFLYSTLEWLFSWGMQLVLWVCNAFLVKYPLHVPFHVSRTCASLWGGIGAVIRPPQKAHALWVTVMSFTRRHGLHTLHRQASWESPSESLLPTKEKGTFFLPFLPVFLSQTLPSIPSSLLRFFSFFIASRGFPSRVLLLSSILYFAHSIINWLHEQYTK